MSTNEYIQMAIEAGWVVSLSPTLPSVPHRRIILAATKLYGEICREFSQQETAHRTAMLLQTLDDFLGGSLITVGGRNDRDAYMKKLENHDEAWEIRSVSPKPSIRVFGMFVEPDVFLITSKHWRQDLGGFESSEFRDAATYCRIEWQRCFPVCLPFKGAKPSDYITFNVVDIRDL